MHTTNQGTVYKKTIGHYVVQAGDRVITCEISNRLRKDLLYPIADPSSVRPHVVGVQQIQAIDPVAVGDTVRFVESADSSGLIVEVLPRRSMLVRREATGPFERHAFEQVIVANLDQVAPVFAAAQPKPSWICSTATWSQRSRSICHHSSASPSSIWLRTITTSPQAWRCTGALATR